MKLSQEGQEFPANQRLGFASRNLEYRSKQALRLLGNPHGSPVTAEQFRRHTSNVKQVPHGATFHSLYGPRDIRGVREVLDESFVDRLATKPTGLPPIICVHVTKGGVGKTSIGVSTAVALAAQGYKVLAIDGDPQASMTEILGLNSNHAELKTLRDVMGTAGEPVNPHDVVISIYDNATLHLIPADIRMTRMERELNAQRGSEVIFKKLVEGRLKEFFADYDVVLIDTGPSSTTLNFNLMVASSVILGVVSLDGLSLKALQSLADDVADIEFVSHTKVPTFLVANKFHQGHKHCVQNLEVLRDHHGDSLFGEAIPTYTGFSRQVRVWAPETSRPLYEEEPTAPPSEVLLNLSRELMNSLLSPSLKNAAISEVATTAGVSA